MAEENKNSKQSASNKKSIISNKWLSLVAYVGIGCIAIALLLTLIFEGNIKIASAFSAIGQVIAYVISIIVAFSWVRTHRHVAWIVCYVIFVVTIVVLFILTI